MDVSLVFLEKSKTNERELAKIMVGHDLEEIETPKAMSICPGKNAWWLNSYLWNIRMKSRYYRILILKFMKAKFLVWRGYPEMVSKSYVKQSMAI